MGFKEDRVNGSSKALGDDALLQAFVQEFPQLADCLVGNPLADSRDVAAVPCTVMLFVEAGRLKFCISPKKGSDVAFGVVAEPVKGFWALEEALASGAYEWKRRRG